MFRRLIFGVSEETVRMGVSRDPDFWNYTSALITEIQAGTS